MEESGGRQGGSTAPWPPPSKGPQCQGAGEYAGSSQEDVSLLEPVSMSGSAGRADAGPHSFPGTPMSHCWDLPAYFHVS